LTVCTQNRKAWLSTAQNHTLLQTIWRDATAWFVGRYVLMPDHLHLFAAPGHPDLSLERWVSYWKSQFRKNHADKALRWQTDHWDRRLRDGESYDAKWEYVRNNPLRAGLVARPEDWPFQGELFELRWC
jgi:putative transposase